MGPVFLRCLQPMFLVDERGICRRVEGRARGWLLLCQSDSENKGGLRNCLRTKWAWHQNGLPSTTVETQQLPSCVAHLRLEGGMGDLLASVSFWGAGSAYHDPGMYNY